MLRCRLDWKCQACCCSVHSVPQVIQGFPLSLSRIAIDQSLSASFISAERESAFFVFTFSFFIFTFSLEIAFRFALCFRWHQGEQVLLIEFVCCFQQMVQILTLGIIID